MWLPLSLGKWWMNGFRWDIYHLVMTNSVLLNMVIEIVTFSSENGDSSFRYVNIYQRPNPGKLIGNSDFTAGLRDTFRQTKVASIPPWFVKYVTAFCFVVSVHVKSQVAWSGPDRRTSLTIFDWFTSNWWQSHFWSFGHNFPLPADYTILSNPTDSWASDFPKLKSSRGPGVS